MSDLVCEPSWSVVTLRPQIDADNILAAIEEGGALQTAYTVGVLELLGISLAILGVVIAIAAVGGFWLVRREAIAAASEAAEVAIPDEVRKYMTANADLLVRQCLKDPEVVSSIQAEIIRLGIRSAEKADDIDTDAERRETDADD